MWRSHITRLSCLSGRSLAPTLQCLGSSSSKWLGIALAHDLQLGLLGYLCLRGRCCLSGGGDLDCHVLSHLEELKRLRELERS